MDNFKVVVIGASQGGVEALERLVAKLPTDLNAAVFIVLHIGSSSRSRLPDYLRRAGRLPVSWAQQNERIMPGRIYVAPPDRHLLIGAGYVRLGHGPKENHTRPAVDPLFRSAALAYGPQVIGIVLTGNLDNGTAGLLAIKECGGTTVVQEPLEAEAPSMPRNALHHVPVDHRLGINEIGPLVASLANGPEETSDPPPDPPHDLIEAESKLVEAEVPDFEKRLSDIGTASELSCPECGAVLFEVSDKRVLRYRCRVGHGFSAKTLLRDLAAAREDVLWSALRAISEEAALVRRLAEHTGPDDAANSKFLNNLADRADQQAQQVRDILTTVSDLIEPEDEPHN